MSAGSPEELARLRERIDGIDRDIQSLISERAQFGFRARDRHDPISACCQGGRDRTPDPAPRSGDERDTSRRPLLGPITAFRHFHVQRLRCSARHPAPFRSHIASAVRARRARSDSR